MHIKLRPLTLIIKTSTETQSCITPAKLLQKLNSVHASLDYIPCKFAILQFPSKNEWRVRTFRSAWSEYFFYLFLHLSRLFQKNKLLKRTLVTHIFDFSFTNQKISEPHPESLICNVNSVDTANQHHLSDSFWWKYFSLSSAPHHRFRY